MDRQITTKVNGQRIAPLPEQQTQPPAVRHVTTEEALAILSADQSTRLLIQASTSPKKLLKVLMKALGPAEAEIEFVERIIIREDVPHARDRSGENGADY